MCPLNIYYAGEGTTELGDWANPPQYRQQPPKVGVLEALVTRIANVPMDVVGARVWKDIPKLRPGEKRGHDERRVGQLALFAREAGADVVVFSRDRDRDAQRAIDIEAGIAEAQRETSPKIVGGVAKEAIEAWVLALKGAQNSESHSKPKVPLIQQWSISDTTQMVEAIESADLDRIPPDAESLSSWLERARRHLGQQAKKGKAETRKNDDD